MLEILFGQYDGRFSVVPRVQTRSLRFWFASGAAEANAQRRKIEGEPRLVSPISQSRLACVPIKCASGASEYRRKGLHGRSH